MITVGAVAMVTKAATVVALVEMVAVAVAAVLGAV